MSKKKIEIGLGEIPGPDYATSNAIKGRRQGLPTEEVEGHAGGWGNVICPHCGGVNLLLVNPDAVLGYECAYCSDMILY